jgi:thiamine biosynthesis protein ThiS
MPIPDLTFALSQSEPGCADKMTAKMKIQINGEDRDCSVPLSLDALLVQLGMKADRVAVELNRRIVPREEWTNTTLKDGDRLEIVHFVGGGATE